MATLDHISGAEPSTITFKVRTVRFNQNSSNMHAEVLVIGDPDSTNALAAVLNAIPASTAWGVVTREAGGFLSSLGGIVQIQGNSTVFQGGSPWNVAQVAGSTWSVRAQNSSAGDLLATVSQGTNPWTIAGNSTVSPLAGSTWATRPIQSSAADLQMTATPLAGSTWNVRPVQSSAADLQATVTPAAGSTWAVRALQSSAADLNASVQPIAGSTWRTQPGSTLWASSAGFHFDSSGGLQISGSITASASTGPLTISQLLDSSGGSVTAADSANNAIRVNVVAGAAGGSTIVTVSTIQGAVIMRSSKADALITVYQSTIADLNATVTPLAGSTWNVRALNSSAADFQATVTPVAGSTWSVRPIQSSKADLLVTVYQSTASEFNATVTPAAGSTWSVRPIQSSAADLQATVTPVAGSTWNVRALQSTASDLQMTATQSAAVWTVNLGTHLQSTAAPSSNSSGIVVRMVVDNILTVASSNAFTSTSLTIQSSGAGLRSYVVAYSITTTNAGPSKVGFYSSGTLLWPVVLAAVSSAVSGVNLAVSAPGYLFRTASQEALALQLGAGASTIAGWKVGVSYFRAV